MNANLDTVSAGACVRFDARGLRAPFEDRALRWSVSCGELPDILPMQRGGTSNCSPLSLA